MKYAILILFIFCLGFSSFSYAQDGQIFTTLRPKENKFDYLVTHARHNATLLIQNYIRSEPTSADINILKGMLTALETTIITKRTSAPAVTAADGNMCDKFIRTIEAYIPFEPFFKQVIRLCPAAFKYNLEQLSQVFVHESYHLYEGINQIYTDNVSSEVGAVRIETLVMRKTFGCSYIPQHHFHSPKYKGALAQNNIKELPYCN